MSDRILVVDDEPSMRRMVELLLQEKGFETAVAASAEEALASLTSTPVDLVISDIRMPGFSGIDLLRKLRDEDAPTQVILITAYTSDDTAVEAQNLGAFAYLTKPFNNDDLLHKVNQALEHQRLSEENRRLKSELSRQVRFGDLVGASAQMREVYSLVDRIAPTMSTVLIQGESGTGKELVARALHDRSPRKNRPFVTVNCGGIPETLLESELFGHIRGAFTGAVATKKGLFDTAQGGTLLLDEIGEMSTLMQVKLLRALQERRIRPVGATEDHEVNARVLTATNQDLEKMVQEKRFREDLYYRVNVITVQLPPLRNRKEDIPQLALHLLTKSATRAKLPIPALSSQALHLLEAYNWPGNIRELENVLERALALAQGGRIEASHLPEALFNYRIPTSANELEIPEKGFSLTQSVEGVRAAYIRKALELEDGVMTRAAERLGITFRSIRYFVKKYHLQVKEDPS